MVGHYFRNSSLVVIVVFFPSMEQMNAEKWQLKAFFAAK